MVILLFSDNTIKWGEACLWSFKQYKFDDSSAGDTWPCLNNAASQDGGESGIQNIS